MYMRFLIIAASFFFGLGCVPTEKKTDASETLRNYLDFSQRDDQFTGGVKMIPISTEKGEFNVWTKRVGNNPKIKVLLLHGGPGMTHEIYEAFDGYFKYIDDFIDGMKKIFPTLKDDWGMYIPEVKYLSPEPLVDYTNLALTKYPNVHFVGDALSARGITVSGAQGIYVAEDLLKS